MYKKARWLSWRDYMQPYFSQRIVLFAMRIVSSCLKMIAASELVFAFLFAIRRVNNYGYGKQRIF